MEVVQVHEVLLFPKVQQEVKVRTPSSNQCNRQPLLGYSQGKLQMQKM